MILKMEDKRMTFGHISLLIFPKRTNLSFKPLPGS